jgi:CMP-N-acetylneuraminic acid synthetase
MNICMIPVRKGSERLAKKNYLKIGSLTILEIAIAKAIQSKAFDHIFINSDDPSLEEIALQSGIGFYLRDKKLASSKATSDQVVLDFFNNTDGDRLFWVNTVSPLQTINDIENFVNLSQGRSWKSGVSVNTVSVHAIFNNGPLNFEWKNGFARTQDLRPFKTFNYAMMGWSRSMISILEKGQLFDEDTQLVESSKWSSFLLKNHDDMNFIKTLIDIAPNQRK